MREADFRLLVMFLKENLHVFIFWQQLTHLTAPSVEGKHYTCAFMHWYFLRFGVNVILKTVVF